jgi:hypothetical protein
VYGNQTEKNKSPIARSKLKKIQSWEMKGSKYEAYQYCVREDEETKKEVGRCCIYHEGAGMKGQFVH